MISHAPRGKILFAITLLVATAILSTGCGNPHQTQPSMAKVSPLKNSLQVVVVVSNDWDSTTGTMECFSREAPDKAWKADSDKIPVNLGRSGLAWGRGLHGDPPLPGPIKHEGDGKAPAGVFELPMAFGYAPKKKATFVRLPYLALTKDIVGVDDVKSRRYNQIVLVDHLTAKDWNSCETMLRKDGLYEWGVVVNHNTSPIVPGAGSCIFLHIWKSSGKPTAGCTAMDRAELIQLLGWLEPKAKPVLVQLPRSAYRQLCACWNLPPDGR
jgi:L,D-peptidoglycan transpeptidase YkuD (ErfK/YbiS/YcfS/YnhG family)